jgi:hypothetical protein
VEERCTECRDGLTCADQWQDWYARCDEVEAELGTGSEAWWMLLEERPTCAEEVECVTCGGSGVIRRAHSAA